MCLNVLGARPIYHLNDLKYHRPHVSENLSLAGCSYSVCCVAVRACCQAPRAQARDFCEVLCIQTHNGRHCCVWHLGLTEALAWRFSVQTCSSHWLHSFLPTFTPSPNTSHTPAAAGRGHTRCYGLRSTQDRPCFDSPPPARRDWGSL